MMRCLAVIFAAAALLLHHGADAACDGALGMKSNGISVNNLHASAANGQSLNKARYDCCKGENPGGFCLPAAPNQYFEVNFPNPTGVSGIRLQLPDSRSGFVQTYYVQYLLHDNSKYLYLSNAQGPHKIPGNANTTVWTSTSRFKPFVTKSLRLIPVDWHNKPCFRMEVLGCNVNALCPHGCLNKGVCVAENSCACPVGFGGPRCENKVTIDPKRCTFKLGLSDGSIKDYQITASSNAHGVTPAFVRFGCCSGTPTGGWCPAPGASGRQWVGIDFKRLTAVTKITIDHNDVANRDKYLTRYAVMYHPKGSSANTWDYYKYKGQIAVFKAADGPDKSFSTGLPTALMTDKLRIVAVQQVHSACFRLELLGCDPKGCRPGGCQNGGFCEDYKCKCQPGFGGDNCQISQASIVTTDLRFNSIKNGKVNTNAGTFAAYGAPKIRPGRIGGIVGFTGQKNQFIDLGDLDHKCYANPSICKGGLTISIYFRIIEAKGYMYIISNGGNHNGAHGVTLVYGNGALSFVVSTPTQRWAVWNSNIKVGEWNLVDATWTKTDGIKLWTNKKDLKTDSNPKPWTGGVKKYNMIIGLDPRVAVPNDDTMKRDDYTIEETSIIEIEGGKLWETDGGILTELEIMKDYPELKKNPTIVTVQEKDGSLSLKCAQPKPEAHNVVYKVEWLVNGQVFYTENVGDNADSIIEQGRFKNKISTKAGITCRVRARYESTTSFSPVKTSAELKPSIKLITKGPLTIHEGADDNTKIDIQLNLPPQFFCNCGDDDDLSRCKLHITAQVTTTGDLSCPGGQTQIPQIVIGYAGTSVKSAICGVVVTQNNWQDVISVPIKAKVDGKYDKNQKRQVIISAQCVVHGNITQTITIGQVQVTVIDKDKPSTCTSLNDPHITTFDGRRYDNMHTGEFILYRHKKYPFQINVYYRKCGRWPSCNCAAAVKSGDDVIVVDRCGPTAKGGRHWPLTVDVYKNGELTPGTKIVRKAGGKQYEVHLPTGTVLRVATSYQNFVNIWLIPSAADWGQTEGLCGKWDGHKEGININQWRPGKDQTIYGGVCPSTENEFNPPGGTSIFCECGQNKGKQCGFGFDSLVCPTQQINQQTQKPIGGEDITGITVSNGQTPDFCEKQKPPDKIFEFNETTITIEPDWPTQSGKDKNWAINYCKNALFGSKAYQKCKNLPHLDAQKLIDNCVEDIKATDDTKWATTAIDAFIQECQKEVDKNIDIWIPDGNGVVLPPDEITDALCPNDCSNHGKCIKGDCACHQNWHGGDCSIDISKPPQITQVGGIGITNGLCPIGNICNVVQIFGENFVDISKLTCHIQTIQMDKNGIKRVGTVKKVKAIFINFNQVTCNVGVINSVQVSISFDGQKPGNTQNVIYYDPKCQKCDSKTGKCTIKPGTCFINGQCHENGAKNPHNSKQACVPTKTQTAWSLRPECNDKETAKPAGNDCVFPFKAFGKMWKECITYFSETPWCSTTDDYDRDQHKKNCAATPTTKKCHFPFNMKGKWYTHCVTGEGRNFEWCSTTLEYDKDKKWIKC